ncbi:M42 family metallopeptidase [Caldisericum exile]|uniref:Peptidase M42 family protein n=1 Tax=Caldisericum exile (strain DSM 21853 / NBRC 104410 / AZM16c01) TaxID=511051 RepID=A0A7U6GES8_CALEA|nr:M42 family peptidase [Caldisericum exile]BAL81059.1 peptidase M42 family protein [Caldisericum exile AZM16c01]
MANIELIKKLSNSFGISGFEDEVIEILKSEVRGYVDSFEVDPLKNFIAVKSLELAKPIVMLNAHMDEVGLIVKGFTSEGYLKFSKVGGIDDRVLLGKRVVIGKNRVKGVIATVPIHLQEQSERNRVEKAKDMVIDIGVKSKEEAEKLVSLGDFVGFDVKFEQLSENTFVGKALDDRLGCALITEILKEKFNFPIVALFSSQEEIGLRGATVGAFKYTPQISITIEGTISADFPDVSDHEKCTTVGNGPVITIKDNSVITDHELRGKLVKIAEKLKVPYQFKQVFVGGTDSSRIQLTKAGVKVLVVAVPVRYIHSPISLFNINDYENTKKLIIEFLKSL